MAPPPDAVNFSDLLAADLPYRALKRVLRVLRDTHPSYPQRLGGDGDGAAPPHGSHRRRQRRRRRREEQGAADAADASPPVGSAQKRVRFCDAEKENAPPGRPAPGARGDQVRGGAGSPKPATPPAPNSHVSRSPSRGL
jgi:hypothetical protein